VDLIVHFAHAKMVGQTAIPALYIEAHAAIDVKPAVLEALTLLQGYERIGLATSVQHLQTLNQVKELLAQEGKKVVIGDGKQLGYPGQVTGCNYSNATAIADDVDAFLFVGGGIFHALGIALSTSKPTIIADPYDNRAYAINDQAQKILKQRFASIQEAKNAKTLGVLVGLKPGQEHFEAALKVKETAEKRGKTALVLAGREITPEVLLEFPTIDAYVNTACPRISLEATSKFSKPVLTQSEFNVAVGEASWESILSGGLFEN
jgi:2-(3-amino-3-carboxypropyl)histidine synthase